MNIRQLIGGTLSKLYIKAEELILINTLQKVFDYFTKSYAKFTGTVDLTDANVVEYASYASENAAIDAGLVPGDKFLLNGVVTTVTKIKQTLTFTANQTEAIGFLVDVTALSPTEFWEQNFSTGDITIVTYEDGLPLTFDSTDVDFSDLTAFSVGSGYLITTTVTTTISLYGVPISSSHKRNAVNGINFIAWVSPTVAATTALAFFNGTKTNISTITSGATVNNPTNFERGKSYFFTTNSTTAAQGLPKTSGVGDPTIDAAYATLALATAGGVEVGQVWYNTTSKRLLTRMS